MATPRPCGVSIASCALILTLLIYPWTSAVVAALPPKMANSTTFVRRLGLDNSGLLQQTAYDPRTDTLYAAVSTSTSPFACTIIYVGNVTSLLLRNASGDWNWTNTGVGGCSGTMAAPTGLAWAPGTSFGRPDTAANDVLFFSTYNSNRIWAFHPTSKQTALVAGTGSSGSTDGEGSVTATFSSPEGIAFIDRVGTSNRTAIVVADFSNSCIREALITWPVTAAFGKWTVTVTTVAGSCGTSGNANGAATVKARFDGPRNVAFAQSNTVMYVGDSGTLRQMSGYGTSAASVTTVSAVAGLSVETLTPSKIGDGSAIDYILFANSVSIVRMSNDTGRITTTTIGTVPPSASVRYVGWLPTGQVLVTSYQEIFTSVVAVLPPLARGAPQSNLTTATAAATPIPLNTTRLVTALSSTSAAATTTRAPVTTTRATTRAPPMTPVPTRAPLTPAPSTSPAPVPPPEGPKKWMWIAVGTGVFVTLVLSAALTCCIRRLRRAKRRKYEQDVDVVAAVPQVGMEADVVGVVANEPSNFDVVALPSDPPQVTTAVAVPRPHPPFTTGGYVAAAPPAADTWTQPAPVAATASWQPPQYTPSAAASRHPAAF